MSSLPLVNVEVHIIHHDGGMSTLKCPYAGMTPAQIAQKLNIDPRQASFAIQKPWMHYGEFVAREADKVGAGWTLRIRI